MSSAILAALLLCAADPGHQASVSQVGFSPDGARIVSSDGSGVTRVTAAEGGQFLLSVQGSMAVIGPGGNRLLAAHGSTVRMHEVPSGRVLWERALQAPVTRVSFGASGRRAAAHEGQGGLHLFDAETGAETSSIRETGSLFQLEPSGERIASTSRGTITLMSPSGRVERSVLAHAGGVLDLRWSRDGRSIVTAGVDGTVRILDAATLESRAALEPFVQRRPGRTERGMLSEVDLSADGRRLAALGRTLDAEPVVRVVDVASGARVAEFGGKEAPVGALAFHPSEARLVTGGSDRAVRLWEAETGRQLVAAGASKAALLLNAVAVTSKGLVATGGVGKGIQLWDSGRRSVVGQIPTAGNVQTLAASPDGRLLAASHEDRSLTLHELPSGRLVHTLHGHGKAVRALRFSPDGKRLASGGDDGLVFLWDPASGRRTHSWKTEQLMIWSLAFSPDGQRLATGGDEDARVWEAPSGRPVATLGQRIGPVQGVAFLPDGKVVVGAVAFGVWDVEKQEKVQSYPPGTRVRVQALALSPDGKTLFAAERLMRFTQSLGTAVEAWDVASGTSRFKFALPEGDLETLSLSADGRHLVAGGSETPVYLLDPATGEAKGTLVPGTVEEAAPVAVREEPLPPLRALPAAGDPGIELVIQTGHTGVVRALAVSPDGRLLASGGEDNRLVLWDLASGMQLRELAGHGGGVTAVAFSPDGSRLASGGGSLVIVWDVRTGREVSAFTRCTSPVDALAFSPDGRTLAITSYEGVVRLWPVDEPAKPDRLLALPGGGLALAYGPAGVAGGGFDGALRLWDPRTGRELWRDEGEHPKGIAALAFSADGKTLASAGRSGEVRLWDAATGRKLPAPGRFAEEARGLAWSPDGKLLAAVGYDGEEGQGFKLWDRGGALVAEGAAKGGPGDVVFRPDGKSLAWAAGTSVSIWDLRARQVVRRLAPRARPVRASAVGPDGALAVAGDDGIGLVDLGTGRRTGTLALPDDSMSVEAMAFSPDGRVLAAGGSYISKGWAAFWDVATGERLRLLPIQTSHVNGLAWSPDGKELACAMGRGREGGESVRVFDPARARLLRSLDPFGEPVEAVAYGAGGRLIAAAGGNTVRVYDAATGAVQRVINEPEGSFQALAFSAAGDLLAGGGLGGRGYVWKVETGERLRDVRLSAYARAAAFGPADAWAALALDDGALVFIEPRTGATPDAIAAHGGAVRSLALSPDGRMLVSGSADGTTLLLDARERRPLSRVVLVGREDHVMVAPDHTYLATKGSLGGIAFRVGARAYPFEQYDLRFNRPDLAVGAIGYIGDELRSAYRRAWDKRLKRMGFTPESLGTGLELPEVELADDLPTSTDAPAVTLRVKAADARHRLDSLRVEVNGVPIHGAGGIDLKARKSLKVSEAIEVPLSAGRNRIQVSAINEKGAESLRQTVQVESTRKASPRLFVLAVGVSRYAQLKSLAYAAKDARDVAGLFQGAAKGFASVQTKVLVDGEATREGVLAARSFLEQATVDDQVVLFVAGHGLREEGTGEYWFGTPDIDPEKPAARGLAADALDGLLEGIAARRKLSLKDTCFSGEADAGAEGKVLLAQGQSPAEGARGFKMRRAGVSDREAYLLLNELFADLRRGNGATVLAAAGGDEESNESKEYQNGFFTFSVLEGLGKAAADADADQRVRVSELRDYVRRRVREISGGRQNPTAWQESPENDFAVW